MIFIVGFIALFVIFTIVWNCNFRRKMRLLMVERRGESICQFARSLPYRQLDTTIMRDVYNSIQEWVGQVGGGHVPIRATDSFDDTFRMDPQDLEDMAVEVARRRGRSLDNCEANPYYDRVHTVGDLVHFLCAQPRAAISA